MTTEIPTTPEAKPLAPRRNRILRAIAWVGLTGLVLVLGLAGYVASLPDDFQVQRTAEIHAPADVVFSLINNFHEWDKWSPWEKLDPNLKRTYTGPDAGPGASYSWVGDANVGEGKMTIEESKPNELVSIRLEFIKPFPGLCPTTFQLEPTDSTTKVTWKMKGKNHFIAKAISLLLNMDQMIGKNFEDGLAKMDTVAQAKVKSEEISTTK